MSIVSYFPQSENVSFLTCVILNDFFIQEVSFPCIEIISNQTILFPCVNGEERDAWMGASDSGITFCLIDKSERPSGYTPFRQGSLFGTILKQIETNSSWDIDYFNFQGLSPFTLILYIDTDEEKSLIEIEWDGLDKSVRYLDTLTPHYWNCDLTPHNFPSQIVHINQQIDLSTEGLFAHLRKNDDSGDIKYISIAKCSPTSVGLYFKDNSQNGLNMVQLKKDSIAVLA